MKKKYAERVRGAALEGVTRRIHGNPKHPFSSDAHNNGPADRDEADNGESQERHRKGEGGGAR